MARGSGDSLRRMGRLPGSRLESPAQPGQHFGREMVKGNEVEDRLWLLAWKAQPLLNETIRVCMGDQRVGKGDGCDEGGFSLWEGQCPLWGCLNHEADVGAGKLGGR